MSSRFASLIFFLTLCGVAQSETNAPLHQARSMVISTGGIVATEQTLASQAGAAILARGGNAVDAAIAANAAMGVVAPMMCGVGGDLFAIVYEAKSGKLYGLNASGWAPAGLTIDFLRSHGWTNMPLTNIHAVTVPGAVAGWSKLHERFARKPLAELLAPAIELAEKGFPVTERIARGWKEDEALLRHDTNAIHTYLPGDHAPAIGEVFRNPDLAATYRAIAKNGRTGFYEGDLARRIVESSQRLGGTMTLDDLREFSAEWVDPISTTYRGWTVYEIPPNGQGIAALTMLNLMEQFDLRKSGHNTVETLHILIEAKKLAYADMHRWVGDPKFTRVPVQQILSKTYAQRRAQKINLRRAQLPPRSGITFEAGPDTTYLCVVDAEGNMISLIQSNYYSFGSGLVPDGGGFVLHNRGNLFTLAPGLPNSLAGHKRPLHTIIPALMERGTTRIAFGIMGGWNQSQAHAQFVSNVVDHDLNIQMALEAPRFTKLTFPGLDVEVEDRIPEAVRTRLRRKGHEVKLLSGFSLNVGGGQAVMRDGGAGVNYGGSDPRKDGAAVPEPVKF